MLRSRGQSSVESAAYRAGERLEDRYYGKIADYTAKGGVICSEILAPDYVPEPFHNREYLWNVVEEIEKHPKAQLAYSFDFALQNEFSLEENITIARQFVLENFVAKGMIVDMVTVCELVGRYLKTKTGVRQSTKQGYVTVQRLLAKEAFGKKDDTKCENFRCKAVPYQIAAGRWEKLQFHSYHPGSAATSLSDGGG